MVYAFDKDPIFKVFPNWTDFPVEDRERIRI